MIELPTQDIDSVKETIARLKLAEKACLQAGELGYDGVTELSEANIDTAKAEEKELKKKISKVAKTAK